MESLKVQNGQFSSPVSILKKNNGLNKMEKLVIITLYSYANPRSSTSMPSQQEIADSCGLTKRSVIDQLNSLIEKGWIKKTKRFKMSPHGLMHNDINSYLLIDKGSEIDSLGSEIDSLGGSETNSLGGSERASLQDNDFNDFKKMIIMMIDNTSPENLLIELEKLLKSKFPHVTQEIIIDKWNFCLENNPKHFEAYFSKSIIKELETSKPKKEYNFMVSPNKKSSRKGYSKKFIRTEIVPEWLNQDKEKSEEVHSNDIEIERKRLEKELAMFKKNKKED